MKSYCALYVDVGYLLAAAATRVAGTSLRSSVVISYPDLVQGLIDHAETASGLPLLRVNWYDSGNKPGGAPDAGQDSIGMLPRVKLRLGRRSPAGEQKGVDLRIGLDLAAHGRGRVADIIYLVSGDDDLSEAVEEAQSHGVQVIVLAVPDAKGRPHAVSGHLIRESDGVIVLDGDMIDGTVSVRQLQPEPELDAELPAALGVKVPLPGPRDGATVAASATFPGVIGEAATPAPTRAPTPAVLAGPKPVAAASVAASVPAPPAARASQLVWSSSSGSDAFAHDSVLESEAQAIVEVARGVVRAWEKTATQTDRDRLLARQPSIPGDLDRSLLMDLSGRLGVYDVEERLRYRLRDQFWRALDHSSRG